MIAGAFIILIGTVLLLLDIGGSAKLEIESIGVVVVAGAGIITIILGTLLLFV